ncbi:MAG TPA: hypothetical protein VM677_09195, partial [Actinokineospora sp.]|nr:hypothetical protein [Actinokineospora sp.]
VGSPALRGRAHEVRVGPLTDTAVTELVESRLPDVPDAVVAQVRRLAMGNPMFVIELAHSLPAVVPPTIGALLAERFRPLSPPVRDILDWAAVIGEEISFALLAAVTDQSSVDTMTALDEAVAAAIVRHVGSGVEFCHPLLRATRYEALPESVKVARHAAVGVALERLRAAGHAVDPAALAHHFGRGAASGTTDKAVAYAVEAGRAAMRILGFETAARRFREALAVDPPALTRAEILLDLGAAEAASARPDVARAAFTEAAELARSIGDPTLLGRAALGRSGGTGMEVSISDPDQVTVLAEAIDALGTAEPALRSRLTARLSVATTLTWPQAERAALAESAIALAGADELALGHALAAHCDVIAGPADLDRRAEQAARVVAIGESGADPEMALLGRRLLVEAEFERGALDRVDRSVAAYERSARQLGDPRSTFYPALWRGALALARGDTAGYDRHRDELLDAAGSRNARILAQVQDLLRAVDFAPDTALGVYRGFAEGVDSFGPQEAVTVALIHALSGRHDEALGLVDAAGVAALPMDSEWVPTLVQLADLGALVPETPLAEWTYQALLPYADQWSVEGIGAVLRGPVERALGLLAARLDGPAEAHFDRAVAACTRAGATAWTARTKLDAERSARRPQRTVGAVLRAEGDVWLVEFGGATARVRDSKGMRDLAELLAHPGREVAALDLVGAAVHTRPLPALDDQARTAYRRRIQDLQQQLDEADTAGDQARSALLTAERDALAAELAGAYGLGGRARRGGSSAERARTAVTTRIRDTIRRVGTAHPALGAHLSRAVRTGTFCVYAPETPVSWEVSRPT